MKEYKLEISLCVLCVVIFAFLIWVAATSPPDPEAYRCRGTWSYIIGQKGAITPVYNSCGYMVPKEEK